MTNKELIRKKISYNFYAMCYQMFLTLIIISNQLCFSYWELSTMNDLSIQQPIVSTK